MLTENFVLIGIIAIAVIIIAVASWYLLKRKSRKVPAKEIHAVHSVSVSEALMLQENDCKEILIKEIYAATNNLHIHNVIGQGVAGKVYKGVLSNGWHVAIKHIVKDGQAETFLREVTNLSHVRHPNLVILRGYCKKEFECFLVYELCGNGSLSEWLFGRGKVLSWHQRLKIAIGSARGLHFLHTFEGGCIVHRDIKVSSDGVVHADFLLNMRTLKVAFSALRPLQPTNILLDDNFEAKLSDFGLSKFIDVGVSHVSSEVRGTFGYVDPEYRQNHHVNAAGDVYSFGMVLLQIISGKRVIGLDITMPASLHKW
ncbi:hypothetical protein IEQ34_009524 [Dendrobium chrysotoxum]|uniref:Protein kinase domain-containing protein n=1 Tax=Dendrobium chrysotoxum TaxID=161865 RepID=A0AAV7H1L6_DENCH|nr:hypothetical protein IEQ34_009524 [Dendrobium chrysotoxum]